MKLSKDDNIRIKEMISSGISRREIFDYIIDLKIKNILNNENTKH